MEIRARETPFASVLVVKGEIDIATAGEFAHELRRLTPDGRDIIVDLSNVEYLDLHAIHELETLHADLKHKGRQLVLSAVPRNLDRLLRIAQVDKIMQIFASSEEAQASLKDGTGGNSQLPDITSMVVMPGRHNSKPAERKA